MSKLIYNTRSSMCNRKDNSFKTSAEKNKNDKETTYNIT